MITIGSLFSGIGGFELGLERAIPNASTIWQVEQDTFCQKVLRKHWPKAQIFDDVRTVGKHNLEPVDILCGGFPCQDISIAGKQKGITDGKKSGLWWEMHRIIGELSQGPKKPIVVLENVPNIVRLGGREVLGSLAELGYDAEWGIISARQFGAPHLRRRWFCVAYPNDNPIQQPRKNGKSYPIGERGKASIHKKDCGWEKSGRGKNIWNKGSFVSHDDASNPIGTIYEEHPEHTKRVESTKRPKCESSKTRGIHVGNYWERTKTPPGLCNVDDGIPNRLARIRALGNAIVPQCSQYIGEYIYRSGLL